MSGRIGGAGYRRAKRIVDVVGAIGGIVAAAPVLAAVAAAIRLTMGAPVVFRQRRIGLGERPFWIYKFRTMNDQRGPDGASLPDGRRLTKFGAFLRRSSLDELPQLLNVLRGEMSIVGPRPLYPQYLPYYTAREKTRHTVRPGITGLAQVTGRNNISWDEKLELDATYVERLGASADLRIVLHTIVKVLRRSDVAVVPGGQLLNVERQQHSANQQHPGCQEQRHDKVTCP